MRSHEKRGRDLTEFVSLVAAFDGLLWWERKSRKVEFSSDAWEIQIEANNDPPSTLPRNLLVVPHTDSCGRLTEDDSWYMRGRKKKGHSYLEGLLLVLWMRFLPTIAGPVVRRLRVVN